MRLNALTYGLRTEHLQLEQMATSQWLLARNAKSERRIYEAYDDVEIGKRLSLLEAITKGTPGPIRANRRHRANRRAAHPIQTDARAAARLRHGRRVRPDPRCFPLPYPIAVSDPPCSLTTPPQTRYRSPWPVHDP